MNAIQMLLFFLALANLIAISLFIYFKKTNFAVALSIIEIILVNYSLRS